MDAGTEPAAAGPSAPSVSMPSPLGAVAVSESERCANCGAELGPRFCGSCGQERQSRRASLGSLLAELFSEAFAVDGQAMRTLRALLAPGSLTASYLAGHRVSYLRPFRLYLIASLALFSSALALPTPSADDVDLYIGGERMATGPEVPGRLRINLASSTSALSRRLSEDPARLQHLREVPPQLLLDRVFAGLRRLLPAAMVLFVPLLALVLKLLHLRARWLVYDHFVLALHLQAALFIAVALSWLIARVLQVSTFFLVLACVLALGSMLAIYLPLALRRVYGHRWLATGWRTGVLLFAYFQVLAVVFGVTVSLVLQRL